MSPNLSLWQAGSREKGEVDEYLSYGHDPEEFMEILKKVMKVQFARFINKW